MGLMKKHVLDNFITQSLLGWLLVCGLPALALFWEYFEQGVFLDTQQNSMIASSFVLLLSLQLLQRFAKMPVQSAISLILPVVLGVMMIVGLVLFTFRLPYSVYYLTISWGLIFVFCFVVQWFVRSHQLLGIAYVPIGRCVDLPNIGGVNWIELDKNKINVSLLCDSVVADFSDDRLTGDWERELANISLLGVPVYHVLQVKESLTGRIAIQHLHENNFGSLLPSPFYMALKRCMDIVIVILTAPLVLLVCLITAIMIKIESRKTGGSVFFVQTRIGKGGKPYRMYKFRSMIPTSESDGAKMAVVGDMRITKFGHFIRKTRIDELPQFLNILKGDMSLIGPRPEQLSFVEQFNESIPFYRYRHIVRPGLSGWAQVMQGYASDEDETRVKLEYDFYYIKNFSLALDLLIIVKTIQTILTGFGAR